MENDLHDEHAHKTQRVPDAVDIILDPAHQFARVVFVKKVRAQRLQISEQILSDVRGDGRSDEVGGILLGIAEDTAAKSDDEDAGQQKTKPGCLAALDHVVHNDAGYLRGQKIQRHRDDHGHENEQIAEFVLEKIIG